MCHLLRKNDEGGEVLAPSSGSCRHPALEVSQQHPRVFPAASQPNQQPVICCSSCFGFFLTSFVRRQLIFSLSFVVRGRTFSLLNALAALYVIGTPPTSVLLEVIDRWESVTVAVMERNYPTESCPPTHTPSSSLHASLFTQSLFSLRSFRVLKCPDVCLIMGEAF